jgi:hypothetical protein
MSGRPRGSAEDDIVYRRRISNEQPDVGRDEGPFLAVPVPGQSYQNLQYIGPPRTNPQRPGGIGGSSDQGATTDEESQTGNPQPNTYQ